MRIREVIASNRKRILILGIVVLLSCSLLLIITRHHWWRQLRQASVTYNGNPSGDSRVYRSIDGDLLVCLKGPANERSLFVIQPEAGVVGLPNENQFLVMNWYAYSKEVPPPLVFMDSPKSEMDPGLVVNDRMILFRTSAGGTVQVLF
jgi:hypothetical protein